MDSRNDKISKFIIGDDKFAVSLFWTNFQCIERVLYCRLVGSLGEGLGRPHVCLNDHVLLRRRNASVECRVLKYDCAQSGMAIIGGLCNAVG